MKEDNVRFVAILMSVIGLAALMVYLAVVSIPITTVSEVSQKKEGAVVAVTGKITRLQETNRTATLTLTHSCHISVLLFKDGPLSLNEGQDVTVIAKIERYDGKNQLIAHRVSSK